MAPRLRLSTCGLYHVYILQMLYINTYVCNTGTILFFLFNSFFRKVKSILLKEGLQDILSSVLHDHSSLLQLLLFGHPSVKLKPTTNMYNAVSKYLELTNRLTSP